MTNSVDIDGVEHTSLSQFAQAIGISRQAASDWLVTGVLRGVVVTETRGRRKRHFVPAAFVRLVQESEGSGSASVRRLVERWLKSAGRG